jgi:hypothetical protein
LGRSGTSSAKPDEYSFEPEGSHYDYSHDRSLCRKRRDVSVPFSVHPDGGSRPLGLVFFIFGLNSFLHFIPQPPPPEPAGAFFGALFATGYMLPLVMGTQLLVGTLLLINRFVPLALGNVAPIVINIIAFHVVLAPSGLPLAIVVLALEILLAWAYREAFRSMLEPRATSQGT